ncbi:MAG: ATP-binding protein [Eubacteriales bacterium]|nr:ATP-binding protein [Eubacteriales bacterium]
MKKWKIPKFKSIRWKLVSVFILLLVATMMIIGTILQINITDFYHKDFREQMTTAFSDELISSLSGSIYAEDAVARMNAELVAYSGRLGINSNRKYYILDSSCTVLACDSESEIGKKLDVTDNITTALNGEYGTSTVKSSQYLDYAIPIGDYIFYIRDNKSEINSLSRTVFSIALQSLGFGIIIAVLLGFMLSGTITTPILNLTKRAERLAEGDYDSRIDTKENDEIGLLANTFNNMAQVITTSMTELSKEKNKVDTIIQYMTDGVLAFDKDGAAIHINPAAYSMLRLKQNANLTFEKFVNANSVDISLPELIYLEHYKTIERDISTPHAMLKAYFAPFKKEDEKTAGVVVVLQDVTEAQAVENMRREFVANVSHELRTPLTTIRGYAETLLDSDLTEDIDMAKHFLSVINREVDRMTRIVKDLLTLSRLDKDSLNKTKTFFSMDELLEDVVNRLKINAKEKSHTLTYSATSNMPQILADRDRIEQVLVNIIANSIKYTPDGGRIEVFAGYMYKEVYVKVKDNGIGIPAKDLPRIFERFYRVDKARSRDKGGTGLGLAIAKEIIELHGGSIDITSSYGKGSEVIIRLPALSE